MRSREKRYGRLHYSCFRRRAGAIAMIALVLAATGTITAANRDRIDLGGYTLFTDGPIRYQEAAWGTYRYVGSDDGFLYCVDTVTGEKVWKFRGGPSNRKMLGAGRLISAWPVSGGPIVSDGNVYFAAGIWPFMGVYIYSLDAESGKVNWVNDRATSLWKSKTVTEQRPTQTDFEPSFISVTPKGQLSINEEGQLLVPCGRALPAHFDLETGELLSFHYGRHKPHEPGDGSLRYPDYDDVVATTRAVFPGNGRADQLLNLGAVQNGYALVVGAEEEELITGLLSGSRLRIIVIDPDPKKVEKLRKKLDGAGVYDARVAVHVGDVRDFGLPPYFASLVIATGNDVDQELVNTLFRSLRPYGGTACFATNALEQIQSGDLAGTEIRKTGEFDLIRRNGALPGSDSWSQEFANAANTQSTDDARVRSPFAVLWSGGPAAEVHRYYENHRKWVVPKVAGGRLFVEGPRLISCFDVYTGDLLWEWRPPENDKEIWSYQAKNVHLVFEPLAGRTAAMEDVFYIVSDQRIHALDATTGKPLAGFGFDELDDWGGIRIVGDCLYLATSNRVLSVQRTSGDILWQFKQLGGSLAIGGGQVFCIQYPWPDRYNNAHLKPESRWLKYIEDSEKMKRRGGGPELASQELVALDAVSGRENWRKEIAVARNPVRRLIYSNKHSALLLLGNRAILDAATGEKTWSTNVMENAVLSGDHVWGYGNLGHVANLKYRTVNEQRNPITLQPQSFRFSKTGNGCGSVTAGRHILTLRSGSAAYFDLGETFSFTGGVVNLGAFRSSCQTSLIPADGLLVSPNSASGGCSCRYPAATALAMVHAPEMDKWGAYGNMELKGPIRKLGINLGAPGDRLGDNEVLWLDYPSVGGPSPEIEITTDPVQPDWFRHEQARVAGANELAWVAASGARSLQSIRIKVGPEEEGSRKFRIRIVYLENIDPVKQLPALFRDRISHSSRGILHLEVDPNLPVCGIELIEAQ